jgi:hypothetical protein
MNAVASGSLDRQLRFAIAHTRLIEVRYGGRLRVAEPHDYGIMNGSPKVLVYQLRASGGPPDFRRPRVAPARRGEDQLVRGLRDDLQR